jgi:hypothetical protein
VLDANLKAGKKSCYNKVVCFDRFFTDFFVSIMISVRGDLTMAEIRQAIFEALCEIEDDYGVGHSRNVTLYLNPTDEFGDRVVIRNRLGRVISRVTKKGPYRSAADEYHI